MKKEKHATSSTGSPLLLLALYLVSSFFGALIFSVLALKAKKKGKTIFWWYLLAIIFIAIFSILSYSLMATSSPSNDAPYFYVGTVGLTSNLIALLVLIYVLTIKK